MKVAGVAQRTEPDDMHARIQAANAASDSAYSAI
jgi:hypothetical protein